MASDASASVASAEADAGTATIAAAATATGTASDVKVQPIPYGPLQPAASVLLYTALQALSSREELSPEVYSSNGDAAEAASIVNFIVHGAGRSSNDHSSSEPPQESDQIPGREQVAVLLQLIAECQAASVARAVVQVLAAHEPAVPQSSYRSAMVMRGGRFGVRACHGCPRQCTQRS